MSRQVYSALVLCALFWAHPGIVAAENVSTSWEWEGVSRVVAIGDLHGSFEKLTRLLRGADLVDEELLWIGGSSHLVVAGDFLDRGAGDRAVMDLLRRIQSESRAAGGRVHVLLGNHEVMNLQRDIKYVNPSTYRDFADEERREDRVAALRRYAGDRFRSNSTNLTFFNRRYPRGFFARQRSLDRTGEYGAWLLGLPAIVKINDVVYVHGGLRGETAALGLDGINRELAATLDRHLRAREVLQKAGIVTPNMEWHGLRAATEAALERRRRAHRGAILEAATVLLESSQSPLLGERGPLSYRGNSFEDERIERESIEQALELLDARALVVAHSPTGGNLITSRFHGQVYRLDHGILNSERPLALVAERGEMLVLDPATRLSSRPIRELPTGGLRRTSKDAGLSDDDLRQFLIESTVVDMRAIGRGSTRPRLVALKRRGKTRRGIFKTVEQVSDPEAGKDSDRYQHEVAAYRLDRRIGLDMVPVTVLREIDGERGSLQSWIEGAVERADAEAYGLDLYRRDPISGLLARGEVFDALIGNHDRTPKDVLCRIDGKRIYLIDHSRSFSTSPEILLPEGRTPALSADLATALGSLDRDALDRDLGALLSERQIDALLERRDRLLAWVPTKSKLSLARSQAPDEDPR